MTNWKEYKLGEICGKIGSGATPRGGGDTYLDSGEYALIRSQNVLDFSFSYNGLAYISEEQAKKLNNVTLEENDILLNITGDSVARICEVPANLIPARVNQHVAIIRPNKKILRYDFLKYYLLNPIFKEHLIMLSSSGATRNAITKGMIENLTVFLPPLPTQTAIAEILSSLDDKIELNNKINQELENLAQTLFKQWFIDFEFPNQNGEPYKSSGGEMVDSELGEIPKGWEVGNLNHIAELNKKNIKPFESAKTVFNLYSLPEFDTGKVPSQELGETILSSKYQVLKHSILVSKLNPRIPRIWTIINPNNNAICSTEFQVLKAKIDTYFPFVNSLCSSEKYISSLQSKVTGTSSSHQRVNPNDIINYEMILPSIEKVNSFYITIYDSLLLIDDNKKENLELTNLRDTLLPKLIAGELEVKKT